MRIRISELNASERSQLLANAVIQRGKDFAEWCERVDAPIIGCFDISASNEGADYWIKVSAGSLSNLGEVTLRSAEIALSIELNEQSSSGDSELQVGKWYGARNGKSRDIVSMFRYNGKSSGRIGWNEQGQFRNDLDDSLDEFVELAPMEMVTLAFEAEAKKRGYALGVNTEHGLIQTDDEHEYNCRGVDEDYFFFHNIKVYKDGDWGHCSITNPAIPSRSEEFDKVDEALRQLIDKLVRLN